MPESDNSASQHGRSARIAGGRADGESGGLARAEADIMRLVGDPRGRNFLEIAGTACPHALAALRLGAERVVVTVESDAAAAHIRQEFSRHSDHDNWAIHVRDPSQAEIPVTERFDIVVGWRIFHHSQAMWDDLRNAAARVAPGGQFVVSLYLRTPFCPFWKAEKRIYSRHGWVQPFILYPYAGLVLLGRLLQGRNPVHHVRHHRRIYGTTFMEAAKSWLGDYPYGSVREADLIRFMTAMGLHFEGGSGKRRGFGLFGVGCGEWAFGKSLVVD